MKQAWHKNPLGGFAALTGGRLAGALATFLASLLIARQFGAETLGVFSVLLALAGIASVVASGGFPAIASVFAAKYAAAGRNGSLKGFVETGRQHFLAGAGVSVAAAFLANTVWAGKIDSHTIQISSFAGTAVLGIAATNFFGAVLVGLNRQQAGLLPDTVLKPLVFLGLVAGLSGIGLRLSPTELLACFAASAVAAAVVTGYQVARQPFMSRKIKAERQGASWRKAALPWIITSLVWDFFIELHIILAGWIAGPAEIAVLHVAFRFRMLAGYGMRALYSLFLPDIVTAHTQNNAALASARLVKVNAIALGYSAAVLLIFGLTGGILMGFFGPAFEAGGPLLVVLSATLVVRALFGPAPALLAMKGIHKLSAVVMLGCLAFSLISTLVLYPQLGLMGIAVSYSTANLIGSACLWFYCKRVTGIDCSLADSSRHWLKSLRIRNAN